VADACECGNEPSGSVKCGKFFTSYKPVSCSRRTLHRGVSKYVYMYIYIYIYRERERERERESIYFTISNSAHSPQIVFTI
jgi:hypothetical protein